MRGCFDLAHQGEAAFKIKVMGGGTTQRGEERSCGCSEGEGGREVKTAATVFTLLTNDFLPPRSDRGELTAVPPAATWLLGKIGPLTCCHGLIRNRESSLRK